MSIVNSIHSVLKPWSGEREEFADLNSQQRLAIECLFGREDFNVTEACRQAGYRAPSIAATRLMGMPIVQQIIGRRIHQRAEELGVDPRRVILELGRIGFLDPRKIINPLTGTLLHLKDMDADTAAAIQSIKVTKRMVPGESKEDDWQEEQTTEVRFVSKLGALEMLAKHVGILKELSPQMNLNILGGDFWDGLAKQVAAANEDQVERKLAEEKVKSIEGPSGEVVDVQK